jgi:hypothetical protein
MNARTFRAQRHGSKNIYTTYIYILTENINGLASPPSLTHTLLLTACSVPYKRCIDVRPIEALGN